MWWVQKKDLKRKYPNSVILTVWSSCTQSLLCWRRSWVQISWTGQQLLNREGEKKPNKHFVLTNQKLLFFCLMIKRDKPRPEPSSSMDKTNPISKHTHIWLINPIPPHTKNILFQWSFRIAPLRKLRLLFCSYIVLNETSFYQSSKILMSENKAYVVSVALLLLYIHIAHYIKNNPQWSSSLKETQLGNRHPTNLTYFLSPLLLNVSLLGPPNSL